MSAGQDRQRLAEAVAAVARRGSEELPAERVRGRHRVGRARASLVDRGRDTVNMSAGSRAHRPALEWLRTVRSREPGGSGGRCVYRARRLQGSGRGLRAPEPARSPIHSLRTPERSRVIRQGIAMALFRSWDEVWRPFEAVGDDGVVVGIATLTQRSNSVLRRASWRRNVTDGTGTCSGFDSSGGGASLAWAVARISSTSVRFPSVNLSYSLPSWDAGARRCDQSACAAAAGSWKLRQP